MDNQQLSDIFKSEYSNLVAVLSNFHGLSDLQLAEDLVSETFLKAMKIWSHKGIPEYPKAWLRKVALNQLREYYRREKIFNEKISPELRNKKQLAEVTEITEQLVQDSQLRMLFVLCDPDLNRESQLCLAVRILCGFNIEEIARALLSNKGSINKKLYRAKKALKSRGNLEMHLTTEQYILRLDSVLRVIYLLFNEGYYSSVNEVNIRHDVCWEAMRLAIFLSKQKEFPQHTISALIALMCFHASRLNARIQGENGDLLYYEQDRTQWDQRLIAKGKKYISYASQSAIVSKYHLEAAIAYWHTVDTADKWKHILQLYTRLLTLEYSPVIALNRTYVLAKTHSVDTAIEEAKKLNIVDSPHFFCMLAELYRMNNESDQEIDCLRTALKITQKSSERALIQKKLDAAYL